MSSEPQANPAPSEAPQAVETENFEEQLAKSRDELLRALAEVENTRRRAERQAADARTYAIDRFAADLLPVADTLARALAALTPEAHAAADESTRNFFSGVEMTEKALLDTLSRHGLRRVGAKGDMFDPNRHQAVAQQPSELPAGAILEVLQPGYMLGERTLRAAMVLVSAGKASTPHVDVKV